MMDSRMSGLSRMSSSTPPMPASRAATTQPTQAPQASPTPQPAVSPMPQPTKSPIPTQPSPFPNGPSPQPSKSPFPDGRSPVPPGRSPGPNVVVVKKTKKPKENEEKEKRRNSDAGFLQGLGDFGFACESKPAKLGCLCCEVIVIVVFCLVMIIIGGTNLSDCPHREFIPIWLLVAGIFFLLHGTINVVLKIVGLFDLEEAYERSRKMTIIIVNIIFVIVQILWLIAGAVAVYGGDPSHSKSAGNSYCDELAYYFSWWLITLILISVFGGLAIVVILFYCFKTC